MNCPTCGKKVKKGQTVCPNCGAMVAGLSPKVAEPAGVPYRLPSSEEKSQAPAGGKSSGRLGWPEPRTEPEPRIEEDESLPDMEGEASEPAERPSPPAPSWVRWVSPIFFLLVFLASQFWLRDSNRPRSADDAPALREVGLAGELPEGGSVRERSEFSLRLDKQVVFWSSWGGSPDGQRFTVAWLAPGGSVHSTSDLVAVRRQGSGGFHILAVLEVSPALPPGGWRVELSRNGEVVTRRSFQLRE